MKNILYTLLLLGLIVSCASTKGVEGQDSWRKVQVASISDVLENHNDGVRYRNVTIGYLTNLYYLDCDMNKYKKILEVLNYSIKNKYKVRIKTIPNGKYNEIVDAKK